MNSGRNLLVSHFGGRSSGGCIFAVVLYFWTSFCIVEEISGEECQSAKQVGKAPISMKVVMA